MTSKNTVDTHPREAVIVAPELPARLPGVSALGPIPTLGALIRERRIELDLTQQELAHRLGTAVKSLSNWEGGRSAPRVPLRDLGAALQGLIRHESDGYWLTRTDESARVSPLVAGEVVDLPESLTRGMTDSQVAEVKTAALLRAMEKAREIRGQ